MPLGSLIKCRDRESWHVLVFDLLNSQLKPDALVWTWGLSHTNARKVNDKIESDGYLECSSADTTIEWFPDFRRRPKVFQILKGYNSRQPHLLAPDWGTWNSKAVWNLHIFSDLLSLARYKAVKVSPKRNLNCIRSAMVIGKGDKSGIKNEQPSFLALVQEQPLNNSFEKSLLTVCSYLC